MLEVRHPWSYGQRLFPEVLKITYAKNADSPDISKSNVNLTRIVNRRKIMDMDEVEAVVEATEEVGVAAV